MKLTAADKPDFVTLGALVFTAIRFSLLGHTINFSLTRGGTISEGHLTLSGGNDQAVQEAVDQAERLWAELERRGYVEPADPTP